MTRRREGWQAGAFAVLLVAGVSCSPSESTTTTAGSTGSGGSDMTVGTGGEAARDECAEAVAGCSEDASCVDTPNFYECVCNPGYEGDGFSCSDINECAAGIDDCDTNASCDNTPGGYSCSCNPGFVEDGDTCRARYHALALHAVHSCALREDQTAWCWGHNDNGLLGIGTEGLEPQPRPLQVIGGDWLGLSAGRNFNCGIKTNGSAWCWGLNNWGQLGIDQTGYKMFPTPQLVSDSGPWASLAAGDYHICALKDGGALYCWGDNRFGQLGNNSNQDSHTSPVASAQSGSFSAVASGGSHSCAIDTNGALWCWGSNNADQLGTGDPNVKLERSPTKIGTDADWASLALGNDFSCALKKDGALWCWGSGEHGQLGTGDNDDRLTPTPIAGSSKHSQVAAGTATTCAIEEGGALLCWGNGEHGKLGDGVPSMNTPTPIGQSKDWIGIAVGASHLCGLKEDGSIECWGQALKGQTGDGIDHSSWAPTTVNGGPNAWSDRISTPVARGFSTCGVADDGALWCWGLNRYGKLGTGDVVARREPAQVGSSTSWLTAGVGREHSCGLQAAQNNGASLWCWGKNNLGQLGIGGSSASIANVPVQVGGADEWAQLSVGDQHSCAIKADGTLWCWGRATDGAIGLGSKTQSTQPAQVGSANDWAILTVGSYLSCAIKTDGALWCWGANNKGQLGIDSTDDKNLPNQVAGDADWAKVSPGSYHSCAIKTGGTLWCWGRYDSGALGIGANLDAKPYEDQPMQVGGDQDWEHVSAGHQVTCAIKTDGTLWCWGAGTDGQLGTGAPLVAASWSPVKVGLATNWENVRVSLKHVCAVTTSNKLRCWGADYHGANGFGTAWPDGPTPIVDP
jgi:alpha-tubulin suppressor-like RCC1 family protein